MAFTACGALHSQIPFQEVFPPMLIARLIRYPTRGMRLFVVNMSKTVLSSSVAGSLLEQHFQIGCQLQDKILRYAVLDEWAGELAIKNV